MCRYAFAVFELRDSGTVVGWKNRVNTVHFVDDLGTRRVGGVKA